MSGIIPNIGFIGAGNMAEALIGAVIRSGLTAPAAVFASDLRRERLDFMRERYGISVLADNLAVLAAGDVIVLAVKPQQMNEVLSAIAASPHFPMAGRKIIVSVAAGIPMQRIETILYARLTDAQRERLPILRVMPNTPALVAAGMAGMSANRYTTAQDRHIARQILETAGRVREFDEDALDAVTALSGSGPAYVFYLIEAMTAAGIELELDPDAALELTVTTVKGAVALLEAQEETPQRLRQKVTSPGGTTEAALKHLDLNGVKATFIEAIRAAAERSRELSR